MYRQELETEQLERGIDSVSSSDEEADLQAHCLQGHGDTGGSESDLPDISVGGVCTSTDADIV